jgi:hypothetical protein
LRRRAPRSSFDPIGDASVGEVARKEQRVAFVVDLAGIVRNRREIDA